MPPTPPGDVVFVALASIPALGNAFVVSGDGDATLRLEIAPESVAELMPVLQQLHNRTFYVALVKVQKGKPHGVAKAATDEHVGRASEEAAQAAQTQSARHRRRR